MPQQLPDGTGTPSASPAAGRGRWGWVLVLLAGTVFFVVDREVYATTHDANLIPGLLLVGASILPATFVVFLVGRGLRIDVSAAALLGVAASAGALSVAASGLVEYRTLQSTDHLPAWTVAVVEETAKLLVPAALLGVRRWRRPINGLVLGVAAGGGFAVTETLGYSAVTLINSHESVASVEDTLLVRSVFTPMTHMAWTGLIVASLWWAVSQRGRRWSVVGTVGVFAFAVALHTTWDAVRTIGSDIALALVSVAALTVTVRRFQVHDHAADEPDAAG